MSIIEKLAEVSMTIPLIPPQGSVEEKNSAYLGLLLTHKHILEIKSNVFITIDYILKTAKRMNQTIFGISLGEINQEEIILEAQDMQDWSDGHWFKNVSILTNAKQITFLGTEIEMLGVVEKAIYKLKDFTAIVIVEWESFFDDSEEPEGDEGFAITIISKDKALLRELAKKYAKYLDSDNA